MKSKITKLPKNIKARLIFNRLEKKNKICKYFKYSNFDNNEICVWADKYFKRKNKKSKISFIRNMCIFTYRNRGLVSDLKLSRHEFKRQAKDGDIAGLIKK